MSGVPRRLSRGLLLCQRVCKSGRIAVAANVCGQPNSLQIRSLVSNMRSYACVAAPAAARMMSAGWTLKAVQQVLGHRIIAFTLTGYGHLLNEDLDAFAEALDITSRGTAGQSLR